MKADRRAARGNFRNRRRIPTSRLLDLAGRNEYARHVAAARALVRDQSRFSRQGGDAEHFLHPSSTSCASQGTTAFASRQVGHNTGALGQGSSELRFSLVANARCAGWLRQRLERVASDRKSAGCSRAARARHLRAARNGARSCRALLGSDPPLSSALRHPTYGTGDDLSGSPSGSPKPVTVRLWKNSPRPRTRFSG